MPAGDLAAPTGGGGRCPFRSCPSQRDSAAQVANGCNTRQPPRASFFFDEESKQIKQAGTHCVNHIPAGYKLCNRHVASTCVSFGWKVRWKVRSRVRSRVRHVSCLDNRVQIVASHFVRCCDWCGMLLQVQAQPHNRYLPHNLVDRFFEMHVRDSMSRVGLSQGQHWLGPTLARAKGQHWLGPILGRAKTLATADTGKGQYWVGPKHWLGPTLGRANSQPVSGHWTLATVAWMRPADLG